MSHPGAGFPIPSLGWPRVGRQWPAYNLESDQARGLVMWMPYGGAYPGMHRHADIVRNLSFAETGTPTWVTDDQYGPSLSFDRTVPDYLLASTAVLTAAPMTISCWINIDEGANYKAAFSIGTGVYERFWLVVGSNEKIYWGSRATATSVEQAETTTACTLNNWYHICGVEIASNSRAVYLDAGGKGINTGESSPTPGAKTTIGASVIGGSPFSGLIRDLRVYNRAFADSEVQQLVDEPWELYQLPRPLWRLGVVAPPATIVPVAMHHYRSMRL